jgi:hypothetical protein
MKISYSIICKNIKLLAASGCFYTGHAGGCLQLQLKPEKSPSGQSLENPSLTEKWKNAKIARTTLRIPNIGSNL